MSTWGDWAAAMKRRGLANGTIAHRRHVFDSWTETMGDRWRSATRSDVERWVDAQTGLTKARSRYDAISHLHALYRWAMREGLVDRDPTLEVERPRLPRRLPRPARPGAVSAAIGDALTPAELAVALEALAGLRCCEVARLSWWDVDLGAGVIWVRGKGDRDRVVPVSRQLRPILAAHDGATGPVMGRRLTPARVSQVVNAHLRRVGAGCTAHQLRHYFATRLLDLSRDLSVVQTALGHASPGTTAIYAQVAPSAVRDAIDRW